MTVSAPDNSSGVPFRKGKRVFLGPLGKEHIRWIVPWVNDQDVYEFLTISKPLSEMDETAWIEGLSKRQDDVIFGIFLMSGELIGVMGLHRIHHIDGTAITGSYIGNKRYWSQGYGTEAKMLLLEYAFNTLNLRKICARVYDFNGRSKRCQEKCGYRVEGILKRHVYRRGVYVDVFEMAVFKEQSLKLWKTFKKKHLS